MSTEERVELTTRILRENAHLPFGIRMQLIEIVVRESAPLSERITRALSKKEPTNHG